MTLNFHQISYDLHIGHTRRKANSRSEADQLPSIIGSPATIDAYRHRRMYEFIRPLVKIFPHDSWMTIGDTGADAFSLRQLGVCDVTATSLCCEEISLLKDKGHLDDIDVKSINAEHVDIPDNSFDFILCKSTYHHLPRAPLAFYELLRVCRKAVIYIEPAEPKGTRPLDYLRVYVKLLLRKQAVGDQLFEGSGNFIYRLSERETRKQAIAIQLDTIAFKYFNDFYLSKLGKRQTKNMLAMLVFKLGVRIQNLMCAIGLMNNARIALIAFKGKVDHDTEAALKNAGYKVDYLPKNPFI